MKKLCSTLDHPGKITAPMTPSARHSLTCASLLLLASCATPETDRDLFNQADTNHDGQLSLDEMNKVGMPRLFNRFDRNGDGAVTLEEARLVEPGFDEKLFTERDLNQDGKVSYPEYEKVALAKGGLKKAFAEVDANRDGIINKAEADAYVTKLEAQSTASN